MAKRKSSKSSTKSSGGVTVIRERSAAPIVKVSAPRAPAKARPRRRRSSGGGGHHRMGGGATGAMTPSKSGSLALGGFIYGYIEKQFPQIPTLPVIGKSGAIALIAYFAGGKSPGIIADVGNAASVIAGYSFGSTGKVSGTGAVSGIAAQI